MASPYGRHPQCDSRQLCDFRSSSATWISPGDTAWGCSIAARGRAAATVSTLPVFSSLLRSFSPMIQLLLQLKTLTIQCPLFKLPCYFLSPNWTRKVHICRELKREKNLQRGKKDEATAQENGGGGDKNNRILNPKVQTLSRTRSLQNQFVRHHIQNK